MKTNEIHLIDRNALRQLRELHPELSQLELAQLLIAELQEALREQQQEERKQMPAEQELASRARLRPTDEQLRRALLRLLALRDGSQDRLLLYKKSHWLAVCRALQHIGKVEEDYGCWTTMERLVMRILGNEAEVCVGCAKKDLCRKASERPYHLPLRRWTEYLNQPKVERYYIIGITLLRLLKEECSGKQTGKVDNFLDRNRQKG